MEKCYEHQLRQSTEGALTFSALTQYVFITPLPEPFFSRHDLRKGRHGDQNCRGVDAGGRVAGVSLAHEDLMDRTTELEVSFTVELGDVPEAPVVGFLVTCKYSTVEQRGRHDQHRIQG